MNKKNKVMVIVGMVVIILILVVLCVLFATNIVNLDSSASKNNDVNSKENYCNSIVGNYIFEEVIPNGGDINGTTSSVWEYKMEVLNINDVCAATLEINGFQTYKKMSLSVDFNNNKYNFLFDKYLDDTTDIYSNGDLLFSLYEKNNKLYTNWNLLLPNVDANKEDNIYFELN